MGGEILVEEDEKDMADGFEGKAELLDEIKVLRARVAQLEKAALNSRQDGPSSECKRNLQAVLDNIPDGILIANVETRRFHSANKELCRMLGYELHDIPNLSVNDIHPAKDLPYVTEQFDREARNEIKLARDIPVKRKDGSIFYADINSFPITIDGSVYITGVFRDMTERRTIDMELRDRESTLRAILDATTESIFLIDADTNILAVNKTAAERLGKSSDDIAGTTVIEAIGDTMQPEHSNSRIENIRKVLRSGKAVRFEDKRDGHTYDSHMYPVFDSMGNVSAVAVFASDKTKQRQAEEARQKSEAWYRAVVESASEAIAVIDCEGVYLFANTTAAKRLGYSPEQVIGMKMWDLFPKEIADRQVQYVHEVIESEQGKTATMMTELQGEQRWENTTVVPLKDSSGKPDSVMIIARDIHEAKLAEEKLDNLRQRMAKVERLASMGTVGATLAHRVTQPLTVVTLSIENALAELETIPETGNAVENLQRGLEGVSQIIEIVDMLRGVAKSCQDAPEEEVCLNTITEEVFRLLGNTAHQVNTRLSSKGMNRLPSIHASRSELEQLFFTLVQNAIQAADGDRPHEIIISGSVIDRDIVLQFSDDCGGVVPEHQDRLFEPFFTTKATRQGTGLGLCVAEQIVTHSGGNIRFQNLTGEGAMFIVTLPMAKEARS